MLVAKLSEVKPYGFKLLENLFYARFRVYRDRDGNGRMKTNKQLGMDLGLYRSCKAILYLKGVAYSEHYYMIDALECIYLEM